jgi:hypothetical protein
MATSTANPQTAEAAPGAVLTAGRQVAAFIEALLLAVWIGSMIFFSFAVAPSAFSVLNDRELAGRIVTSAIGKIEWIGLISGPLLLLIQATAWKGSGLGGAARVIRGILLVLMTAMAALSKFWISAKMASLRIQMGGIENVPPDNPLRIEFNFLHGFSTSAMAVALLAGFVVLFLTVRSWLKR